MKANAFLAMAAGIVSRVLDAEENAFDNIPENLQSSDLYDKMEKAIDALSDASDCIDTAIENISAATG